MKLIGHIKEILSGLQDILTLYLGSPREISPPEELGLEEENHPGGRRLSKTRGRVSSHLLACNKLTADS